MKTGLKQLEGKQVCAVVYDSDISINYNEDDGSVQLDGSLKGANYGVVAFKVLSVTALDEDVDENVSSSSLPKVELEILNADDICDPDKLSLFDAPELVSSSEPADIDPNAVN